MSPSEPARSAAGDSPGVGDTPAGHTRGAVPEATTTKPGINDHQQRRSCLPAPLCPPGPALAGTRGQRWNPSCCLSLRTCSATTVPVSHPHSSGLDPAHEQGEQHLQHFLPLKKKKIPFLPLKNKKISFPLKKNNIFPPLKLKKKSYLLSFKKIKTPISPSFKEQKIPFPPSLKSKKIPFLPI